MTTETTTSSCGAKSSKCPRMDLIPYEALVRLAGRYELGLQRYGRDNWRKGLSDKEYVLERAAHVLNHVARFMAKLEGHMPDDGEDDAAAILWGGAFLCCATDALAKPELNCSACGGPGYVSFHDSESGEAVVGLTCPACKGTGKQRKHG